MMITVGQDQFQESDSLACYAGKGGGLSTEIWSSVSEANGEEMRRGLGREEAMQCGVLEKCWRSCADSLRF